MEKNHPPHTITYGQFAPENIERYQSLIKRLVSALANRPVTNQKLESPGFDLYFSAFQVWMKNCAENPEKAFEQQVSFWRDTASNYFGAQQTAYEATLKGFSDEQKTNLRPKDRRFSSPYWEKNPWLKFLRDQYLTTAQAAAEIV
ncbi:MAG: hypothetical protein AAGF54_14640, partial [Pseudomonadota bacterium]